MKSFPETTVHKTVPLKFAGVELQLKTSHALFSSHHVDDGTMLLLKTLAQRNAIPAVGRVLDVGCGVGPLALAIKKFRPELAVTAQDRLALAATFTAENARINRLEISVACQLLLDAAPGPWDLLVSNVPAKAGEPVLTDFISRSLGLLAPGGLAAVVVVEPLAAWFSQEMVKAGALLDYQESASGYEVFHYRRPVSAPVVAEAPFPEAYRRGEFSWNVGPRAFQQQTFYGLPNFDGLDYRLQVTLPLLENLKPRGEVLFWEPVQGHLATWADSICTPGAVFHLAGNDTLGLAASVQNLPGRTAVLHAVPSLSDLDLGSGSIGFAMIQLHPEPEIPWVDSVRGALLRLVAPGGLVLINGTSTHLTRFLDRHQGLRKLKDDRFRGWRAVLLERQNPV